MRSKIENRLKELMRLNGEKFVHNAYLMLLNREPDKKEKEHFISKLRRGEKKIQIILDLCSTPEALNAS